MAEPRSTQTATEIFESMNYFDEMAVFKAFGSDIVAFAPDQSIKGHVGRPMLFLRALALVELRRKSDDHAAAWEQASGLTFKELEDYFQPEEVELDENEPETEQGKEPTPSE